MAFPTVPTIDYSYTAFQQAQGTNEFPGTQLDNDLAKLATGLAEVRTFLEGSFRSDGGLLPGTIPTTDELTAYGNDLADTYDQTVVARDQAVAAAAEAESATAGKADVGTTLADYGITDAAPLAHVGSGGSSHALATSSAHGFMASTQYKRLAAAPIYAAADYGVVVNDRGSATTNATQLNAAVAAAIAAKRPLCLPAGEIFCDGQITQDGALLVYSDGHIAEWSKSATSTQGVATTTIVMTGTGSRTNKIYGMSSMVNWGGGRVNASARSTTHNDGTYKFLSFITSSTSDTGRTRKGFSVAWHMTRNASGSEMRNIRIIPDYGGTHGIDGYKDSAASGNVAYALSSGEWDVGLWCDNTRECLFESVQVVGQWRMAGLLGIAAGKTQPAALYKNTFLNCTFSGYHGAEIRSFDAAPVVAYTTTSIDVPWADDHPFGADSDMDIFLSSGAWPSSTKYTFTTMAKITGGAYDILRISGITPDVPSGTTNAFPYMQGGGSSGTLFIGGEIQGFEHPSRYPCHIKGLAGVTAGVFDSPGGCLFISGTRLTEIETKMMSITGREEIAVMIHDCRNPSIDGYLEMNGDRARVVTSGPPSTNTHSLAGFAHGGCQSLIWIHRGSTTNNGSVDTRPALPNIDATAFTSDSGMMEVYYTRAPYDPGQTIGFGEGNGMLARPGSRVGIGRRTSTPDFYLPNPDAIDWAFYYDYNLNHTRVRKLIRCNTAAQADIGSFGAGAFGKVVAQAFSSYTLTIADDAVGTVTPPTKVGLVMVVTGPNDDTAGAGWNGIASFDTGSTPGTAKTGGSTTFVAQSGTAALTGTFGTDGNLTVGSSVDTFQIENRTGASRVVVLTFFGAP